jgi:hypothetical protein
VHFLRFFPCLITAHSLLSNYSSPSLPSQRHHQGRHPKSKFLTISKKLESAGNDIKKGTDKGLKIPQGIQRKMSFMKRKKILITSCAALAGMAALLGSSCSSMTKRADASPAGRADGNKDGKISTDELNKALVKGVFEAADENGNGSVILAEWKLVFPDATKEKFQAIDQSNNGSFNLEEALAYCEKQKTFDQLVNKIDSNGDGIIDKEEAGVFYDKMQGAKGDNEAQKLKTLID